MFAFVHLLRQNKQEQQKQLRLICVFFPRFQLHRLEEHIFVFFDKHHNLAWVYFDEKHKKALDITWSHLYRFWSVYTDTFNF